MAAFTGELSRVAPDREIVALHPTGPVPKYAYEVHHRIRRDERADYVRAAASLEGCADVVSIQFDDVSWGGEDGEFVLDLVGALRVPAIVTLHAVTRQPTPRQRQLLVELVASVDTAVVMSRAAATVLEHDYGIKPARLVFIPYGVPDLPILDAEQIKPVVDLAGRTVILGAGMLDPDNGFERVIEALPAIARVHPDVIFAIVGATHPDVVDGAGEAYRDLLSTRAKSLGVGGHVRFVDEAVGRVQLTRWIQAADVVVTPYHDLGTTLASSLAQAMGAGRAVVSTRYAYAVELLAGGRGVLVSSTPEEIGAGLLRLLGNTRLRAAMGTRAHAYAGPMAWSRVGVEYQRLFDRLAAGPGLPQPNSTPASVSKVPSIFLAGPYEARQPGV